MSFLDGYELANDTIIRFRKEYPSGRIITKILKEDFAAGWVVFVAEIYREFEDAVPSATSTANGNVAFYPTNMKKWFVEDTETSAIARAIKLLSPTTTRPSREDMSRVEFEATPREKDRDHWATVSLTQTAHETGTTALTTAVAEIQGKLGSELVGAAPRCPHGTMIWAEGTAKATGKLWAAYKCTEKNRANQCNPVWHVMTSSGQWKPQV